ncbi:Peroxisome biosynthesis protein pex1 [Entomophthora muscae]|uniref:Peroxisome biosynthesis protein pex1 n=1 Tax=Entomophthora muscae TaxID=34485 RepID=A0ACC2RW87_9FUNG|nr:Peroxisome biosynthesis protein pex1 [Entomophthora muscae]
MSRDRDLQFGVTFSNLHNCSVQLPPTWANPLLNANKKPQQLVFELIWGNSNEQNRGDTPKSLYVGWSGLVAPSTYGGEVIVIDRAYALASGLSETDRVAIKYTAQAPKAKSVELAPSTVEDWEVLQLNAGFLEEQFLNQCRVVAQGQIVTLWVQGQAQISMRVITTKPQSSTCVVLQNSSEIYVQPLTRLKKEESEKQGPGQPLLPSRVLRLVSESVLVKDQRPVFPNAFNVLVHPASIVSLGELAQLGIHTQDFPTLATLTVVNRGKNDTPAGEETAAPLNRPSQLVVSVNWSTSVHIGMIIAPFRLMATLHVPCTHILRAQLSFRVPSPVQPRQLRIRPIFPAAPSTGTRKKRTEANGNSKQRSWISQAVTGWFQAQSDVQAELAITHNTILTIPGTTPLTMTLDIGTPDSVGGCSYALLSAQDWARLSIVEVDPAHFVPPQVLAHEKCEEPQMPSPPQLGAVDEIVDKAFNALRSSLGKAELRASLGVTPYAGILLCGARGAGKTSILEVLQAQLRRHPDILCSIHEVDCGALSNERVAVVQERLEAAAQAAAWCAPAILSMDNLDALIPAEMEHMDSFRFRQLAECFVGLVRGLRVKYPGVGLVATSRQPQAVHPLLLQAHAFTVTLHIPPPTKLDRQKVLIAIIAASPVPALQAGRASLDLLEVAGVTEGYLPCDLQTLTERAVHHAAIRQLDTSGPLVVTGNDFIEAQKGYTPVSLRGVKLQTSTVRWSDVGGLEATRATLRETLEWPIKYQAIFQSCPLRLRSGLLLYGFPGCGKTLLASAVARECHLNFITVKGPEILNKYIGASEQSVRDLFQRAQAARPCVLFFDEFEAIAPRRGHDSTGVTDRVVNQLLTQMDGAEGLEGVYVLAATSRPDLIDPALLRPGRLDKSLLCHMPTVQDRLAILNAHASKFHLSSEAHERLEEVANRCVNFTGADLQALLYNAHLEAIHQTLDATAPEAKDTSDDNTVHFSIVKVPRGGLPALTSAEKDKVRARIKVIRSHHNPPAKGSELVEGEGIPQAKISQIEWSHIIAALASTSPSLPPSEIHRLGAIYDEFQFGKGGGDRSKVGKRSTLG